MTCDVCVLYCPVVCRANRRTREEESDYHDDDQLLTDQQKEEEQMFKSVFSFYQQNRGGVPIERYELPMLLDGKCRNAHTLSCQEMYCQHMYCQHMSCQHMFCQRHLVKAWSRCPWSSEVDRSGVIYLLRPVSQW